MAYNREQQKVIKAIKRIGKRRGESRKEILAALTTGRVEANFQNPKGPPTDHDSLGWRQERQMYYKNPTNLRASINRFFKETSAKGDGKGMSVGELAQAVQRSAYPDRYQTHIGEAKQLYRGGPGGSAKGGGKRSQKASGGSSGEGGGIQQKVVERLETMEIPAPTVTQRPPVAPIVSAQIAGVSGLDPRPASVQNFQPPAPVQKEQQPQLLDVLKKELVTTKTPKQSGGGGKSKSKGGGGSSSSGGDAPTPGGGQAGTVGIIRPLSKLAKSMGLGVSGERSPAHNASVGGASDSDHLSTNQKATARDVSGAKADAYARKVAKKFGRKSHTGFQQFNKGKYRITLIWQAPGHYDHVHVSARRL